MNIAPWFLGACVLMAPPSRGQEEPTFEQLLQKRALDPLRHADRIETFALEDVMHQSSAAFPSARPVPTDLPGRFVALPERTPMTLERGREIAQLLLSPRSYAPWISACLFSPGVSIRFHQGSNAVDVFVCFQCREVAFQTVGQGRSLFKLSFNPIDEQLFHLIKGVRPDDTRLDAVWTQWNEEAEETRRRVAAEERWREAMPSSLRPHWRTMNATPMGGQSDLAPLLSALATELPEPHTRILALLEWFGAGTGPWSGYPAYEGVAEDLLLSYSTSEVLAAVRDRELTPRQTEGAARLFAGWQFGKERPGDGSLLGPELRERLLRHSMKSDDKDKQARAKAAFEPK